MDILDMSDLQISLIIIGIIIIAGVMAFNWLQQLRYRREVQEAFENKHDDVLLEADKNNKRNERIEPQLNKSIMPELQATPVKPIETTQNTKEITKSTDSKIAEDTYAINYVATIRSDTLISNTQLSGLLQQKFDFDKPVHWLGQHKKGELWKEITLETIANNDGYNCLQGCLQLVDRVGPVSEVNLSKFRDLVQNFATQANAIADCPDIETVYEQAILLDKFCANVDVMIGINIISKDEGAFVGTKIRALAEASGFRLEKEGVFKYRDENHNILFTLNNYESVPFQLESMRSLTTHGITFLLDVPRVANGEKIFDQMTHIARIFSNTLGGIIVDDNRVPLSDNGIIRSKKQLSEIQDEMKTHGIPAGSKNAMKLFV